MTKKRLPSRPRTRTMALEPRVLFDGAAAVAGAEHFDGHDYAEQSNVAEKTTTTPAVEATASEPTAGNPTTLLIIDARVADHQSLLADLPANATIRIINTDESGLGAISEELAKGGNFDAIHIVSHGTPGSLTLGNDTVNNESLSGQSAALQSWADHLSADADILLYGCDVAQGDAGQALITQLAQLTGADIAASTNATGNAAKGGDWVLESNTGSIEAGLALSASAMQGYGDVLADPTVTDVDGATATRSVTEDQPLTITGITLTGGSGNQTVTLTATNGTLTVAGITGTVTGNGTGSVSFTAPLADVTALLSVTDATKTLKFQGNADWNGTTSFDLKVGNATKTINVLVIQENDNPSLTTRTALVLQEGNTQVFTLAQLASSESALDVDIQTGQQVLAQQMLTVKSLPPATGDGGGTLTYNGGPVVVGSVIPVSDIVAGKLKFTHNGTDITARQTATFDVEVTDGGGGTTGTVELTVYIDPKNIAPTISTTTLDIYEGQSKVVAPLYALGDNFDTASNSTFEITAFNNGTIGAGPTAQGYFFFDTDGSGLLSGAEAKLTAATGSLTLTQLATLHFHQEGGEPNTPASVAPSYTVKITDAGGGEGAILDVTKTITLNVLPNNDQPVVTHGLHDTLAKALTVDERSETTITTTMLQVTDPDLNPADPTQTWPAANIVYTLAARPAHGELLLEVSTGPSVFKSLDVGGRFTQADIDDSKVKYYQKEELTGTDLIPEVFKFTVRDSAFGYELPTPDSLGSIVPGAVREGNVATGAIKTLEFHLKLNPNDNTGSGSAPGYDTLTYDFTALGANFNGALSGWAEGNVGSDGVVTKTMLEYKITRTIGGSAIELPPTETVYTLTALPTNGLVQREVSVGVWQTLAINANFTQADINGGKIRFQHDGNEDFVNSFGFTVSDGTLAGSLEREFKINTAPVNDRPGGSGGNANVTEGNGNTVSVGAGVLGMSDVDGSTDTEADAKNATGNVLWNTEGNPDQLWFKIASGAKDNDGMGTSHGKFQYWNGSAWTDIVPGVDVWLHQSILTQNVGGETSGLRYVHDGSEPLAYANGTPKLAFTYVVRDDLAAPTGGANAVFTPNTTSVTDSSNDQSPVSAAIKATIGVIPINDAPQVPNVPGGTDATTITATITGGGVLTSKNEVLTVTEGGSGDLETYLIAVDRDNTMVQRQFIIKSLPTLGELRLNGKTLGVGSTFTQADIEANQVLYVHTSKDEVLAQIPGYGSTYHDKFHFAVNDGVNQDSGTNTPDWNTFLIKLAPANDIPTIAFNTPADATNLFIINSTTTGKTLPKINLGDLDLIDAIEQDGEQDFVQVTVEFLTSGNVAYTNGVLDYVSDTTDVKFIDDITTGNTLVFQGKLVDVQAALDKVQAKVTADDSANPADLKIKVTVDDRLRDASGVITDNANGGSVNTDPTKTTIDATNNRVSVDFNVAVSTVNNPPAITVPGSPVDGTNGSASVLEDIRTLITGITFTDPDAFESSTNTVTLMVDAGRLYFHDSNNTVPGGATATGVGTATVTLTGTKAQLDTALAAVRYVNTVAKENFNGTTASAKDATLTVTIDDGGNTGMDGAKTDSKTIAIQITPVNDAPTVVVGTGTVVLTPETATNITGIAVADKDIRGDISTNDAGDPDVLDSEANFVQVTVRVVLKNGASWDVLAASKYNTAGTSVINIGFNGTPPSEDGTFDIDNTYSGAQSALVIRGEIDKVNAYLAGLTLRLEGTGLANADARYGLEVIVDDRVRLVSDGTLSGSTANGGLNASGLTTATPPITAVDPYAAVPTGLTLNVASAVRELLPSDVNNPATITEPLTTAEGSLSYVTLAGLTIADPDAIETDILKATVTLPTDFKINALGTSGGTFTGMVNDTSFTIQGTLAQINARLDTLQIGLPDVAGDAVAADWNGSFDVTVVVEDLGNNGSRPATLGAGDNATTGTFTYDNGSDNKLITTRTITFTVTPTNDAPVAQLVAGTRNTSLLTINEDPGYAAGDAAGTNKTVNDLFLPYFNDGKDGVDNTALTTATGGTSADTFWGVAVVDNAATVAQGQWQYHNGTTWIAIATDVANTKALILDSGTPVRFSPAANYFGDPGKLSVRLIENNTNGDTSTTASIPASDSANQDIGTPGGTSRYSADVVTLGITVTNVNDPPVAINDTNEVTEDSGTPATGNVKTGVGTPNTTTDSDIDNTIAELTITDIRTGPETGGTAGTVKTITSSTTSANGEVVVGQYGTLTIGADGSYSYVLDNGNTTVNGLTAGGTLTEQFTYTLKDPSALSDTAQLTITIKGNNDGGPSIVPVDGNGAANGQVTVHEAGLTSVGDTRETNTGTITLNASNGLASITVGGTNVSLATLNTLATTAVVIDTPNGKLTLSGFTATSSVGGVPTVGTLTYSYTVDAAQTTPSASEDTEAIALVITDAAAISNNGTLTVQIIDDTPTAVADTNSITKGTATVTGNAFTNDSIGADGPPSLNAPVTSITDGTLGAAKAGTYGAITLNADGTYSYALDNANSNVVGLMGGQTLTDTFNYTITDKDGDTATTTVTITINGVTPSSNAVPVARSDSFTTKSGTPVSDTLKGNDSLGDGSTNQHNWSKTTDPSNGTVVVNSDGTFTYTPNAGFGGTDSFTYTIRDADGDTSTTTVTIVVDGVPVAVNDSATTPPNTPVNGSLKGNDTPSPDGGNVWTKTSDPSKGTATVNPDGTYTYTPNTGFTGTDTFTYTITDTDGDTSTATVTITVGGVPIAKDDSASTPPNTPVNGSLKGNDTPSPDGGNVWTKTTEPSKGTATVNPDGTYTYTPNTGFTGTDTFTYTITDKDGDTSTATVTIKVNNVPVAVNDSFTTKLDNPVGGSLVGNDTPSLDGGNVWSKTSNPSNGTVTVNPDGSFTYTPNTGFTGTDSFLYTITDKDGDQSTATASITVNASTPIAPPPPPPPPPVTPPVAPPIIIPEINNPNPQGNGLVDANRPAPSPILPGERPQLQPEAPLQPRNVLGNSPVILDAGPYFSGERFNDVRRLPLPFHPIVYVNREVVNAQLERAPDDVRVFSQPGMATPGDINLQSQAMGLGMDPNLFVQHSVRDTQRHASFLGSTVDGRLGRVSLSGDWLLPTPELFQPDVDSFLFNPVDKDKDKDKKGQDVAPQGDAENAPQAANEEGAERKASAANDSPAPAKTTARLVSPSFAQQLRNAAGRLPVVSRNI